jgi:hypothetical protein
MNPDMSFGAWTNFTGYASSPAKHPHTFFFLFLYSTFLYYTELDAAYDVPAMTVELNIFPQYGLVHRRQKN